MNNKSFEISYSYGGAYKGANKRTIVIHNVSDEVQALCKFNDEYNSEIVYSVREILSANNHKISTENLISVMRLTSANLRDLAISIGSKTIDGQSCHDLADRLYNATMPDNKDNKLFACIWGNWEIGVNNYEPNTDINSLSFFEDNNGYEDEDIAAITQLELGKEYNVTYGNHKIIRIA